MGADHPAYIANVGRCLKPANQRGYYRAFEGFSLKRHTTICVRKDSTDPALIIRSMDQSQIDLVAIYIDAHYVLTQRSKPMRIAAFATWNVKDPSPIQKMGPRPQIWRWMERVAHLPFGLDFFPSLK